MDLRSEVLDLFAKYNHAFTTRDHLTLSTVFCFPFEIQLHNGAKHVFETHAEMLSSGNIFQEACASVGITRVDRIVETLHITNKDEALLISKVFAYSDGGAVSASWRTSFFVRSIPNIGIRIAKIDATELGRAMERLGFPLQDARLVSVN